jgi:nitrite reductase (NADH) large subunit
MEMSVMGRKLVIVGNGMAAARLAEELSLRAPGRHAVAVVGAEPHPAYNRVLLSSVLAGDRRLDEIGMAGGGGAVLHAGERVQRIDRESRAVLTASGRRLDYDTLVLATGSWPIVLPIPGAALPGVMQFRDIADVERMIAASQSGGRAVVVGGGLLGLEAAEGLRRRGMDVTVIHLMPWLMERQLDQAGGAMLRAVLERRGLGVVLAAQAEAILGENCVRAVRLKDGRELPADLVVMTVGIRPRIELAQAAGLACGRGVQVDDAMQTSDPAIYAIGECAEHRGRCYGLVEPVWQQAAICARHIAGDETARYAGSVEATSLKVGGIELYSAGTPTGAADMEEIVLCDHDRGVYRKLMVRDGRLVGAVLLGDAMDGHWYGELISAAAAIAPLRRDLAFGRRFTVAAALAA